MLESQVFNESVNNFKDDIKKIQVRSFFFLFSRLLCLANTLFISPKCRHFKSISNKVDAACVIFRSVPEWTDHKNGNASLILIGFEWHFIQFNIQKKKKYAIHFEEIEPSDFPICNCNFHEFQLFLKWNVKKIDLEN